MAAVLKAASALNAAKMMVDVLIDLLSSNTRFAITVAAAFSLVFEWFVGCRPVEFLLPFIARSITKFATIVVAMISELYPLIPIPPTGEGTSPVLPVVASSSHEDHRYCH
jgi:hypothetical protein